MSAAMRNDADDEQDVREREEAERDPEVQEQVRVQRVAVLRSVGGEVPEAERNGGCHHDGRIPALHWAFVPEPEPDS